MSAEPVPAAMRWTVRNATADTPMAIIREDDAAEVTFGTLVSFPSYMGKTHYGAVTELFQAGGYWWVTVVGPYAQHSPHATGFHRRASQADDLTILGIPHPRAGEIWTHTDEHGHTNRLHILEPDGLYAVARNLGTGRVGRVGRYILHDYHPEPPNA